MKSVRTRFLAGFLVVVILFSNMMGIYADESKDHSKIAVSISQDEITEILEMNEDERPVLEEDLIPFAGATKDKVLSMIQNEIEGRVLLTQGEKYDCFYLVTAGSKDGIPVPEDIQIIGINGNQETSYNFELRITGEDVYIIDGEMTDYQILEAEWVGKASASEVVATPQDATKEIYIAEKSYKDLTEEEMFQLAGPAAPKGILSVFQREDLTEQYLPVPIDGMSIFVLNTTSDAIPMNMETPYEYAQRIYDDGQETVRISIRQQNRAGDPVFGNIKAGERFIYQISFVPSAYPLYDYGDKGISALVESYDNTKIILDLPVGVVLDETELYELEHIENTDSSNKYQITLGRVRAGNAQTINLNAYINQNGERGIGEEFQLGSTCLTYQTDIMGVDKSDDDNPVSFKIEGHQTAIPADQEDTKLITITSDQWGVRKTIKDNRTPWEITSDKKHVKISYLIEVGILDENNNLITQPNSRYYLREGRVPFSSYQVADTFDITAGGLDINPDKLEVSWESQSTLDYTINGDQSGFTVRSYQTGGGEGDGTVFVEETAPTYTRYYVTAYYPYESFRLPYYDERIGNASIFTINNEAELTYTLKGGSGSVVQRDEIDVQVQDTIAAATLRIRKYVEDGSGAKLYNRSVEGNYGGMSQFEIYQYDPETQTETLYDKYTVVAGSQKLWKGPIYVNPTTEAGEDASYTTGDNGYVDVLVEPGIYIIKEIKMPAKTGLQSITYPGSAAYVTVESGRTAAIDVLNKITGSGQITFKKVGKESASAIGQNSLNGVVFDLYKSGTTELVASATSDRSGNVNFYAIAPGTYTVKERSTVSGYMLSTASYDVTVTEDGIATLPPSVVNNTWINYKNSAPVTVTKHVQKDDGLYQTAAAAGKRADFNRAFSIQKKVGDNWISANSAMYSLDSNSRFTTLLPIVDAQGNTIEYRIVETVPAGYTYENPNLKAEITSETINSTTYVYHTFKLSPFNSASLDLHNGQQGKIRLAKYDISMSSGGLNVNNPGANKGFTLYRKNGSAYEVVQTNVTPANGILDFSNLEVFDNQNNKYEYYLSEVVPAGYELEVYNGNSSQPLNKVQATVDGNPVTLHGSFTISRESQLAIRAYNVPQKVPYLIRKVDAFDGNKYLYNAVVTICVVENGQEEFIMEDGNPSVVKRFPIDRNSGLFLELDPGKVYRIYEVEAPDNYILPGGYEEIDLRSVSVPIKKADLERWYGAEANSHTIKLKNTPFPKIKIDKTLIDINATTGAPKNEEKPRNIRFEVYQNKGGQQFEPDYVTAINSNTDTQIAPGEYYFKEVGNDYIRTLLETVGSETYGNETYYGPVTVAAPNNASAVQTVLKIKNVVNKGSLTVRKVDSMPENPAQDGLSGAVIKISATINGVPYERTATTGADGTVTFVGLQVYDGDTKIVYTISEETAPEGYWKTDETIATTLVEAEIITTKNGNTTDKLELKNEPKRQIVTGKVWQDEWMNQFEVINHELGGITLALYEKDDVTGDLVFTGQVKQTDDYAGQAAFEELRHDKTYYVIEVFDPLKDITGLTFDLTMPKKSGGTARKEALLPAGSQIPAAIPGTLTAASLDDYNYVEYLANDGNELKNMFNYRSWVQFQITKICDQTESGHTQHEIDGARFTLYKQAVPDQKSLSVTVEELQNNPDKYQNAGSYESGTRVNEDGTPAHGKFDTQILEPGYIYWLVETEAAPSYYLDEGVPWIVAVWAPQDSGCTIDPSGGVNHLDINYYADGKQDEVKVTNKHRDPGTGVVYNRFKVMLNKWLETGTDPVTYKPLGNAKFELWLTAPGEGGEKILLLDTLVTGLENSGDPSDPKTGYALSRLLYMHEIETQLRGLGYEPEDIITTAANGDKTATFLLVEVDAPAKIEMDPDPHYFEMTITAERDVSEAVYYTNTQFVWEEQNNTGKTRLVNRLMKDYRVLINKFGYQPDDVTFSMTDTQLDAAAVIKNKTPLNNVTLVLERKVPGTNNYQAIARNITNYGDGRYRVEEGLPLGEYRIYERALGAANSKYYNKYPGGEFFKYFTVDGEGPVTVNIYNPEKPSLEIEKTTWDGSIGGYLEGITFKIKKGQQERSAATELKDNRYVAEFMDLEPGNYTIVSETLAANDTNKDITDIYFNSRTINVGYQRKNQGTDVVLDYLSGVTGFVQTATIENPRKFTLEVAKVDGNDADDGTQDVPAAELQGAEFDVYFQKFRPSDFNNGQLRPTLTPPAANTGWTKVGAVTTGANGKAQLENCAPGWYKIVETKAPDGYSRTDTPLIADIRGEMSDAYSAVEEVEFKNYAEVTLNVTKKLTYGDFKNEIESGLDQIKIKFNVYIKDGNQFKQVAGKSVTVTGFVLDGAFFSASESVTLPQNPKGGAYYLKEDTTSSAGWLLDTSGLTVENGGYIKVNSSFDSKDPAAIEITNIYGKAKISIKKVGDDGNTGLSGAEFKLYKDSACTIEIGKFTENSAEDGTYTITFAVTETGAKTYYIKETKAPDTYIKLENPIPVSGVEPGKHSDLTVEASDYIQNTSGLTIEITKYNGSYKTGITRPVMNGVTFELYSKTNTSDWEYVGEAQTQNGKIRFTGYTLAGNTQYALYEQPIYENGQEKYVLDSLYMVENGSTSQKIEPQKVLTSKNNVSEDREIYILNGLIAGNIYQYAAYNMEAVKVQILKNDLEAVKGQGIDYSKNPLGITVDVEIREKDSNEVVMTVKDVPYGIVGKTILLQPGEYIFEEIRLSDNTGGYVINKDDTRVVYQKPVTVPEEASETIICNLVNVKTNMALSLKKDVILGQNETEKVLEDLYTANGSQEITYKLTPNVTNSLPLDGFMVEDTGLVMYDSANRVLDGDIYTKEQYTIKKVDIGPATHEGNVWNADRSLKATTGPILADVEFFGFDGSLVASRTEVDLSAAKSIPAPANSKVATVKITYYDPILQADSNGYALGQNFKPGTIDVTMEVFKQDAKLEDDTFKEMIAGVENRAETVMTYRNWTVRGTQVSITDSDPADASVRVKVVDPKVPVVKLEKTVEVEGKPNSNLVNIGDKLAYTITLTNITEESGMPAMKDPFLTDLLPIGVELDGSLSGSGTFVLNGPAGFSFKETPQMRTDVMSGQATLLVPLEGELQAGESVSVTFKVNVTSGVIKGSNQVHNYAYASSGQKLIQTKANPFGASFKIKSGNGTAAWPQIELPDNTNIPVEYEGLAHVQADVYTVLDTTNVLQIFKEVKGNLDDNYRYGDTAGNMSGDGQNNGEASFRLTVKNTSENTVVPDIQLMDILPHPLDIGMDDAPRFSKWQLDYVKGSLTAEIVRAGGSIEPLGTNDFKVTYSDQDFKSNSVREDALADLRQNPNGFWQNDMAEEDISAFRFHIDPGSNFSLNAGDELVITYKATAQDMTPEELEDVYYEYAVNNFTILYRYKEGEYTFPFRNPITSNFVQLLLRPSNVKVGGRIWIDANNNGIQDEPVEHLLDDLETILTSDYFKVVLKKYEKDLAMDDVTYPAGDLYTDGSFVFENLSPASPKSNRTDLYVNDQLNINALKGVRPANYRIEVMTGVLPSGFEDLVLKAAKPVMMANDSLNPQPNRSREPQDLVAGGSFEHESKDSNFTKRIADIYQSENFFLWADKDDGLFDKTKDIGFVPYRRFDIVKQNHDCERIENTKFAVYGPFTDEELESPLSATMVEARLVWSGATGADGKVSVLDSNGEPILLYYANYIFAETEAAENYTIEKAYTDEFTKLDIFDDQATWLLPAKDKSKTGLPVPSHAILTNGYASGSLEFTKIDESTTMNLAGVEFELTMESVGVVPAWTMFKENSNWNNMGIELVEIKTDSIVFKTTGAEINITGIPYGTYTLKEVSSPNGYNDIMPAECEFTIDKDHTSVVLEGHENNIVKNYRSEFEVQLLKNDTSGNLLEDVEFTIEGPGTYTTPPPFLEIFLNAKFKPGDASGESVKRTGSNGIITWELPHGDYKITESDAGDGYKELEAFYIRVDKDGIVSLLNNTNSVEVDYDQNNSIYVVQVTNEPLSGQLELEKTDNNAQGIIGASFTLSGASDVTDAWQTYASGLAALTDAEKNAIGISNVSYDQTSEILSFTMEQSSIVFADIPYGTYTLEETQAPAGYILGDQPWKQEFTIAADDLATQHFAVENTEYELNIIKVDPRTGYEQGLQGAEFILSVGSDYVQLNSQNEFTGFTQNEGDATRFVTDDNGMAVVKKLPVGDYLLTEVVAPENYHRLDHPILITVDGIHHDNAGITVVIENQKATARIALIKTAAHDTSIRFGDTEFGIYSDPSCDDMSLVTRITTNYSGWAESEELPHGIYYVKELTAPIGCDLNSNIYQIELNDTEDVHFVYDMIEGGEKLLLNNYSTGHLSFEKVDEMTEELLADAVFRLENERTEVQGAWIHFIMNLLMMNADDLEVMGISSVALHEDGMSLVFKTIDSETVKMRGLPYGDYRLYETEAPHGYEEMPKDIGLKIADFSIDRNQEDAILIDHDYNIVENKRRESELILEKIDSAGNKLEGVEFTLEGPGEYTSPPAFFEPFIKAKFVPGDASSESRKITDASGRINWNYVPYGDYRITENFDSDLYEGIEAFYIRIDKSGNITLLDGSDQVRITDQDVQYVEVTNTVKTGGLTIHKKDGDDETFINGAEFELKHISGGVPGAWEAMLEEDIWDLEGITILSHSDEVLRFRIDGTSQQTGIGRIKNLPYGEYEIWEVKPPAGYILTKTPWESKFIIGESAGQNTEAYFTDNDAVYNKKHELEILKRGDGKILPGVEFLMKTADGQYVILDGQNYNGLTEARDNATILVTASNGTINIIGLPSGTYRLEEIKAPKGFVPLAHDVIMEIGYDETQYITVINHKPIKSVTDDDGDGSKVFPIRKPELEIYEVYDEAPPLDSYPVQKELVEPIIKISENDTPTSAVPKTGDQETLIRIIVSLGLLGTSAVVIGAVITNKKKRR